MIFDVKVPILGFETTTKVRFSMHESGIATLASIDGAQPFSLKMLRPSLLLKEYEFDLPANYKALLEVTENSQIELYCILIMNKNIQESSINLLCPVLLNHDNHTMAQIVLDASSYPHYRTVQEISQILDHIAKSSD